MLLPPLCLTMATGSKGCAELDFLPWSVCMQAKYTQHQQLWSVSAQLCSYATDWLLRQEKKKSHCVPNSSFYCLLDFRWTNGTRERLLHNIPEKLYKIIQKEVPVLQSKMCGLSFSFLSFFYQLIILLPKNQNSRVRHSHYHMFTLPTSSLPKVSRRGTSLFLFPTEPFMKTLRTSEKRWTGYNRASIRRVIAVIGRLSGFKKKKKKNQQIEIPCDWTTRWNVRFIPRR